jgi:homoserine dehydrogenase
VRVGVLGCGNVGAALVELIGRQAKMIESAPACARGGASGRPQPGPRARRRPPPGLLTRDSHAFVEDPEIDVVSGDRRIEPAR